MIKERSPHRKRASSPGTERDEHIIPGLIRCIFLRDGNRGAMYACGQIVAMTLLTFHHTSTDLHIDGRFGAKVARASLTCSNEQLGVDHDENHAL